MSTSIRFTNSSAHIEHNPTVHKQNTKSYSVNNVKNDDNKAAACDNTFSILSLIYEFQRCKPYCCILVSHVYDLWL